MLVGVLALQGAFREHERILRSCGADVQTREIRLPKHLEGIERLVIPGGESTTMGKLMTQYDLFDPIKELALSGLPVFGTCAGLIMMARKIEGSDQPRLGLMDMVVERNAFGRQVESFEADLHISSLGPQELRGIFIRAPFIKEVSSEVEILAEYKNKIVCARQGKLLAASFHPELTEDLRLHQYFLGM